jgi:hypothetical protein
MPESAGQAALRQWGEIHQSTQTIVNLLFWSGLQLVKVWAEAIGMAAASSTAADWTKVECIVSVLVPRIPRAKASPISL